MWSLSWKLENKFKLRSLIFFSVKIRTSASVSFLNSIQIQLSSDREKQDFRSYFTFTSGDNCLGGGSKGMGE